MPVCYAVGMRDLPRDLIGFLIAVFDSWQGWMAGGVGLIFTIVAFKVETGFQPKLFALLAVGSWTAGCFRAWRVLEADRRRLNEALTPRLEIQLQPSVKPYVHDWVNPQGHRVRTLRVRVRNCGGTAIEHARLVLDQCAPDDCESILPDHEFRMMGREAGELEFALAAGGEVMLDIASEVVVPLGDGIVSFYFEYAQQVLRRPLPAVANNGYKVTLRAEGGDGAAARRSFVLGMNLSTSLSGFELIPA